MEISLEEYLQAREIVKKYHEQIEVELDAVDEKYLNGGKTSVHEFLDKNEVSSRLKRVLLSEYHNSYIQDKYVL